MYHVTSRANLNFKNADSDAILRSKVVDIMPFHAVFFLKSLAQKLRKILPIWIHFYEILK
jgi:hypothetical protein